MTTKSVFSNQLTAWETDIEALTPYKPAGSTYQRDYLFVDAYTIDQLKGDPKKGITRRLNWANMAPPEPGGFVECTNIQNYRWTIDLAINYTLTTDKVLRRDVVPTDAQQILDTLRLDSNRVTGVNFIEVDSATFTETTEEVATLKGTSVTTINTLQTIITMIVDTSEAI